MSKKGNYTSLVRKRERNQIARQEKEVIDIKMRLRTAVIPAPAVNEAKARRSLRLAHKRKHKQPPAINR
ncbi:hypothetical protein QNN03_36630 [Streptomyces sp. GXMU-J15]|uniref:30S ribosomal protein S20 n=1 Tax=Streptomyces fuscus TaxID=3048495 RepID=A0ABT7JAR0_9ACTN|nr:hypothetical protein [Streptomyces fuscus]MDL2081966.1 hypothetical protein [Streptomyces fuscus]